MSKKIGVMIIGAKGAVATTLIGAWTAKKLGLPEQFNLPSEADELFQNLPLIPLEQLTFAGWDISSDSYSQGLKKHQIIPSSVINKISTEIDLVPFFPAVVGLDEGTANKIKDDTQHVEIRRGNLSEQVNSLRQDIQSFKNEQQIDKVIVVNLSSTDRPYTKTVMHQSVEQFIQGMQNNSADLSPSMLYAYASIQEGCHLINFTPSDFFEIPALIALAKEKGVALSGRDGKTGQTLYKTVIAPMFKYRGLKIDGWYSTNILGNRDGLVLNEDANRTSKISSKKEVLEKILGYNDFSHQVHIHYYPPRGDAKEAWDNIDFQGWFNTKMQMKINWLGVDSILAAPLVLDLIRWMDFFSDKQESGVLTQLSVYFKQPIATDECDYFKQITMLHDHVRKNYL